MNANGKESLIKLVTKGDLLGKTYVLSGEKASLSAVAIEDMEVCFIPKSEIFNHIKSNNLFSIDIMRNMSIRLQEIIDTTANSHHKTVKERLASTILNISEISGVDKDGYLKLQLTRDEIASMIGTATESCIRLIADLKKLGHIETKGKKIKILQLDELKKLAE